MAWETRERGGLYYTRSRKVNGRVRREYVGSGPGALAISQMDEGRRMEHKAERGLRQMERREIEAVDDLVEQVFQDVEAITRATLEAAGYHRPKRGPWRKRREHHG
jgi:predicted phage gp36 major capsid-like protein